MPPRGVKSAKRERQYEHIKDSELKQGRSTRRAKQIAAATVNKERRQKGETKGSRKSSAGGRKTTTGGRKKTTGGRAKAAGGRKKTSSSRKTSSSGTGGRKKTSSRSGAKKK
jgi:hypothetical protein